MRDIDTIAVHCSATPEGRHVSVDTIRKWHRDRGFRDIGYHFIVHLDGTIETGRPVEQVGAHVKGHNRGSIGICYIGGVDANLQPKDTRTSAQKRALKELISDLAYKYQVTKICGHRDFGARKACPSFDAIPEYKHFERRR